MIFNQFLKILIYSDILILQIGHVGKFLLHFKQVALCLQGRYNASLSLSQHMIHK